MKIVYVKWRKPVSTYAISACEALVASVNSVNMLACVDDFSRLTSIITGKQSLSVIFYTVKLRYSRWFTKYLDAETIPELEPGLPDLPADVSGNQLLSWSSVPTAERYVDTVGVFVEEFLLQSHIDELNDVFQTQLLRE